MCEIDFKDRHDDYSEPVVKKADWRFTRCDTGDDTGPPGQKSRKSLTGSRQNLGRTKSSNTVVLESEKEKDAEIQWVQ
jgi:hypothetical protein